VRSRRVLLLFICPSAFRDHVVRRLRAELPDVEFEVVYTDFGDPDAPPNSASRVLEHPTTVYRWLRPSYVRTFREMRSLIADDVDLVVLHGYHDAARLALLRWAQRARIPVLVHTDSNILNEGHVGLAKKLPKDLIIRWVLRYAGGLLPTGVAGRAYFRSRRQHHVPEFVFPCLPDTVAQQHVVDVTSRSDAAHACGLDPAMRWICYGGRLSHEKGVDLLLSAFSEAASEVPGWGLAIAGDGPEAAALNAAVTSGLLERVRFLGRLSQEQMRVLWTAAHVMVLPSRFEAWSVVLVEAVAAGRAVVVSDITGAAVELVRPRINGLLFRTDDVESLRDALIEVCRGDVDAMGAASRRIFADWLVGNDPVDAIRSALDRLAPVPAEPTPLR
jgi:glycosyltransferase involved in cell wall biosynthesis